MIEEFKSAVTLGEQISARFQRALAAPRTQPAVCRSDYAHAPALGPCRQRVGERRRLRILCVAPPLSAIPDPTLGALEEKQLASDAYHQALPNILENCVANGTSARPGSTTTCATMISPSRCVGGCEPPGGESMIIDLTSEQYHNARKFNSDSSFSAQVFVILLSIEK